jgi:predicted nucleic-acid-binding Zn-ribbon protein
MPTQPNDEIDKILLKFGGEYNEDGELLEWSKKELFEAREAIQRLIVDEKQNELASLLKTTDYNDVPYFVGVQAVFIEERIQALGTKHEWVDNDTWSVFKCKNCGYTNFAPHPLPEYGCHKNSSLNTKQEGK